MADKDKLVYWHRDLPPLHDRIEGEHHITAKSDVLTYDRMHADELWGKCFPSLERTLEDRLAQEIKRQSGHCAHVVEEHIHKKINHDTQTYWLEGEYVYVLYLAPRNGDAESSG